MYVLRRIHVVIERAFHVDRYIRTGGKGVRMYVRTYASHVSGSVAETPQWSYSARCKLVS